MKSETLKLAVYKFQYIWVTAMSKVSRALPFIQGQYKYLSTIRRFWQSNYKYRPVKKSVILVEVNDSIYSLLGMAGLGSIVAVIKQARIIYWGETRQEVEKYRWLRNSFTDSLYISTDELCEHYTSEINDECNKILDTLKCSNDLLTFTYEDLLIGDTVYDQSLRINPWQATVWRIDKRVEKTLFQTLRMIRALKILNNMYEIKASVFSHIIGYSGACAKYLVRNNISVYVGLLGSGIINRYSSLEQGMLRYYTSLPEDAINRIMTDDDLQNKMLMDANKYLEKRHLGELKDWDSVRAFSKKKKYYENNELFCDRYSLDKEKPIVFIMLHAFNDFPHHFPRNLYSDYYHWFIETLRIVRKIPSINWVFKEHPTADHYPSDVSLTSIFTVVDEKNILLLDRHESFNTLSLKHIAHAIVTCIGTAALEFSCFGIPAIVAGDNHFTGYGICEEPKDISGYILSLKEIGNLRKLNDNQVTIAKILFYLQYYHLMGQNSETSQLIPILSHEERIAASEEKLVEYFANNIDSETSQVYLQKVEKYINTQEDVIFHPNKLISDILNCKRNLRFENENRN